MNFYDLKRSLVLVHLAGSVRCHADLVALFQLIKERREQIGGIIAKCGHCENVPGMPEISAETGSFLTELYSIYSEDLRAIAAYMEGKNLPFI